MKYIIDTNVFIDAHQRHYPFDVVPSFWNELLKLAESGVILSLDKVFDEIEGGGDELAEWCKDKMPIGFFQDYTLTMGYYQLVAEAVENGSIPYTQGAKSQFLEASSADAFLIALALSDKENFTLVTCEKSNPLKLSKVFIPDICNLLNVQCMDTVQMLRKLNVRL